MAREPFTTMLRAARSDLPRTTASPAEHARLISAVPPISDPLAQSYVVWRRSVLIIAAFALLSLFLFEIVTWQSFSRQAAESAVAGDPALRALSGDDRESAVMANAAVIRANFGDANLRLIDFVNGVLLASTLFGAILIGIAAWTWHRPRRSRAWARAGWLVLFVTPFILSLLPMSRMIDWNAVDPSVREDLRNLLGIIFAMTFFMMVGPKAISLAPAIVRSSMTLKTLLPEASAPGWAAVFSAPLMILLVIIVMSAIVQLEGSVWLLLGTLCLAGSPVVYIARARSIITPQPQEQAERLVHSVRRISGAFTMIALVLIGFFFFRSVTLSVADGFRFGLSVLGNVLALKVVAADLLIPLLWTAHQHGLHFHESPEQQALDRRFHILVAADVA